MQASTLLLGCALLAVGAAGCLTGGTPSAVAPASLTEQMEAHADDTDASLIAVVALEVTDADHLRERLGEDAWLNAWLADDAAPGDGQAPTWALIYREGAGHDAPHHLILVDGDGDASDPAPLPTGFPVPVTGPPLGHAWTVDAPQAAQTTAQADAEWAAVARSESAYVLTYLVNHVDKRGPWGPTWIFETGSLDGPEHEVAAVNTTTGEPRPLGVIDPFSPTPTVEQTLTGTVDTASPTADHTVLVEPPGHKKFKFLLDVAGSANNFDAVATGPDGQEFHFWWESGNGQTRWQTYDVGPGEWTITVTLKSGETQDYAIHFCAVGATHCTGA